MKKIIVALVLSISALSMALDIAVDQTITQNFDGIGVEATATLPTDWRADKQTAVRLVGTYDAALTVTTFAGGNDMSASASGGVYNYGAGDAAMATDRCVGWMGSSSTKAGNLYLKLTNSGTTEITRFELSYDIEKYRKGSNNNNPAYTGNPFRIKLHTATDGATWTEADSAKFVTAFEPDPMGSNDGYNSAPGLTNSVTNQELVLSSPLAPGASIYMAWNYAVQFGTYTSYAQGLGIDNVSIKAGSGPSSIDNNKIALSDVVISAYPNPFNPTTSISFTLPQALNGSLAVYNQAGQKVTELFNGQMKQGLNNFQFNAADLNSGVYFCKLVSGTQSFTNKMVLTK